MKHFISAVPHTEDRCSCAKDVFSQRMLRKDIDFSANSCSYILYNCFLSGRVSKDVADYKQPVSTLEPIFHLKLLGVTFILIMLCTATRASALPRLPVYQDVEAALESTMCAVREEIVDIRKIHPNLPSNANYNPSCVLLRKCSGCCQNDMHKCMPTSIYTTKVEISQELLSPRRLSYITLNFTQHADCKCQSSIHPTCIPRVCSDSEVWDKDKCLCEARCAPRECGHRKQWNPETCRCQCQQCHPNRLVHSRFIQDEVTCICACRHAFRNRIRCKRRPRLSTSQCTCVSARGFFGHFGQSRS